MDLIIVIKRETRHLCQVWHRYESVALLVKNTERLPDLLFDVSVVDLSEDEKTLFQNCGFCAV